MLFRKKPVVIEAIRFTGGEASFNEVKKFMGSAYCISGSRNDLWDIIYIETLNGQVVVTVSEWIIKGVNGEFYPCADDIFQKTYEAVDAAQEES